MANRPADWVDLSGKENVEANLYGPGLFRRGMSSEGSLRLMEKETRANLPERSLDSGRTMKPEM